jgi:PIN domain nuclease of toxin-antitoxin system
MRFIADTHAFIWFVTDSPQRSVRAKELFESTESERLLSMASLWEIAIKANPGKLAFARPLGQFIPEQLALNYVRLLDILLPHVLQVGALSLYHRDPFDRMIIAQSLVENLPVLSSDNAFDAYGVNRIW